MNEKKSWNTRTILLVLLSVVTLLLIAAAVYFGFVIQDRTTPEPEKPTLVEQGGLEKPKETSSLDQVKIDLVDYTTYRLEELDFQFVIAKIRVKSEEPINIGLEHFKTNEGTALDQIDTYLNTLDQNGLYIGKQNVWFELVSTESTYVANVFIPIKDKNAQTASLAVDFGENANLEFDLKKAKGNKVMLDYQPNDVITDGKTYQMVVSVAFKVASEEVYRTFEDGSVESAGLPSTAEVYAFKLEAVSLWGDEVVVEDAVYSVEGTTNTFQALPSGFYSEKYTNILGKTIKEKDSGVLFFVTYNAQKEPITYQGKLKLKIKGQENWIDITVNL